MFAVCVIDVLWCNCVCFSVFLFSIGLLILAKALDRETVDQYLLLVTASDGQPGGVSLQPSFHLIPLLWWLWGYLLIASHTYSRKQSAYLAMRNWNLIALKVCKTNIDNWTQVNVISRMGSEDAWDFLWSLEVGVHGGHICRAWWNLNILT